MRAWLKPLTDILERGDAAMLVHVVALSGSGPREVGAQMLVTETAQWGTIGGGELERAAVLAARERLPSGKAGVVRYALGPEFGQCCGGAVSLAFEPFAPVDTAWLSRLMRRTGDPDPQFRLLRFNEADGMVRGWQAGGSKRDYAVLMGEGRVEVVERINPIAQPLWIFGAGHVGRAVVGAVAPLGFAITWIDGRAGQFPNPPLKDVRTLALAMPELIVDDAPPGTMFLVMTHSHPLDEAICEAILGRGDFAYLGLIGSRTKLARFRKRLGASGVAPMLLNRLVCPIGVAGIASKEPSAIGASVAADLLIRRERAASEEERALHG